MPEITREEVRQYLRNEAEAYEALGQPHYASIHRLALAALEDAERVDALAYDLEGGPIFDEYAKHDVHEIAVTDPQAETDERGAYCRAFRTVITRALAAQEGTR